MLLAFLPIPSCSMSSFRLQKGFSTLLISILLLNGSSPALAGGEPLHTVRIETDAPGPLFVLPELGADVQFSMDASMDISESPMMSGHDIEWNEKHMRALPTEKNFEYHITSEATYNVWLESVRDYSPKAFAEAHRRFARTRNQKHRRFHVYHHPFIRSDTERMQQPVARPSRRQLWENTLERRKKELQALQENL